MRLDLSQAVEASIYAYEDGKPYLGDTWPSVDGVAIIICPDCGEIDEDGRFFEVGTVYSTWGDLGTGEDDRCNLCKCHGYMFVGI